MKKNQILMLLAMIAVFRLSAEPVTTEPVATLNHDGQITQYNGSNALQAAHNDAVSGDIITLNGGTFNACTITKGITLRGACMGTTPEMEEQGMRSTSIGTEMRIQVPLTETNTLIIEDMCFDKALTIDSVPHVSFSRVYTSEYLRPRINIDHLDVVQCCLIFDQYSSDFYSASTVYSFVNSAITFKSTCFLPYHVYADHCNIKSFRSNTSKVEDYDCVFKNCIFASYEYALPYGCVANYCVAVDSRLLRCCTSNGCKTASLEELFENQEGTSNGQYVNPLTEEAAATYLGADGTQVGIYGGAFPFTMMPNNPIVISSEIAEETTEDGKLRVKIEVKSK